MPGRSYEQDETKRAQERDDDIVATALLRQDMKYVRQDLAELKGEFRDLKQYYVTKDEATASRKDVETRLINIEGRMALVIKVGVAALLAFTGAVATAIAKLIFKV